MFTRISHRYFAREAAVSPSRMRYVLYVMQVLLLLGVLTFPVSLLVPLVKTPPEYDECQRAETSVNVSFSTIPHPQNDTLCAARVGSATAMSTDSEF